MDLQLNQSLPSLAEFLSTRECQGTAREYNKALTAFNAFLINELCIPLNSVDENALLAFRFKIVSRKLAASTVNQYLAAIISYFNFIDMRFNFKRIRLKSSSIPIKGLTNAQALDALKNKDPLERAVLLLMFNLGLRRQEVTKIAISDLYLDGIQPILKVSGKGGKFRELPLSKEIVKAIQSYLHTRASIREVSEPLFSISVDKVSGQAKPLHVNTIYKIFKRAVANIEGSKNLSPHSARVTAISNALENGASVLSVMHMAGHSSIQQTVAYDRRRQELKSSAVFKINYRKPSPLSNK